MALENWSEDIVIAQLNDEPALTEDLNALVLRFDAEDERDVILDMSEIHYLNSTNIAQLLRLRKRCTAVGRRMKITRVSDSVWGVMLVTGLDKLFDFTDDVTLALASLQMGL
ncbi:MAG: STAS domain-containing protein [Planctomycetota bacterium]|nr:STAS domain-containing protein [Planctomycetota bacterium]